MDPALIGRFLVSLAVIALVLLALRFGVRLARRPFARRGELVRILETQFLPGGTSLHVVDVVGRCFLIGRGAQIALLAEVSPDDVRRARSDR
jgi:flagellar biogenesis protein FliO